MKGCRASLIGILRAGLLVGGSDHALTISDLATSLGCDQWHPSWHPSQRVIPLLKDIEVDAARRGPENPGVGFVFGWLWKELGVTIY